ncbi:MAG: TRAP transporter small permease subunit [Gammaproteobacteria bacterium]|jgi:TRAP-type mannitol/chloroaromatic compound transport system permease small subunit
MSALLKVSRAIDVFNGWIGRLIFWLVLLMILVGVYNATVRYLGGFIGHNLSSNAYLELQWYFFGAIFMLGASYALQKNAHVRVDIIYARFSPKGRAWIDLIGTLVFLLPFSILVFWLSLHWVEFSWRIHETSSNPGGLPRYPIKTVVPVAFVLLILQGVSQIIKAVAVIRGLIPDMFPEENDTKEPNL